MSIQALREAVAADAKALKELVDPSRTWNSAKDQPIYDELVNRIDENNAKIGRIQAANERAVNDATESRLIEASGRIALDKKDTASALFNKWLRNGSAGLNGDDWTTLRNTMSTTTNTEGGFTVAQDVAMSIVDKLKAFGGVRRVATVLVTAKGNAMSFPVSDGTAEEGEIVGENASAASLDIGFTAVSLTPYKYSSKVVKVPFELLQDSMADIETYINNRLITRLGRITNKHLTIGTGSSQPQGVVTGAGVGVTAANSSSQVTAITYASLVDLQHSVDVAYRETGNCVFMFNDNSMKVIRKIVDGQSRPIFVPGYDGGVPGGVPNTILGSPVVINSHVADMGASAKSVLFGDFSAYMVRDALDIVLHRFTDSAYAEKGQVGFLAHMRTGGALLDTSAVKVFVNAAS